MQKSALVGHYHHLYNTEYDRVSCVSHSPGVVSQARLFGNQEGANTERCAVRKVSVRRLQRGPFWHRHYPKLQLWRYRPWKIGPGV